MFTEWGQIESDLAAQGFDINGIKDELISGRDLQTNLSELKQRQVAGDVNVKDHFHMEGIGECFMRVDADVYFHWAMRLGAGCWSDKGFRKEFIRDNPEVRVKSQSRSTHILVP